MPVITGTPVAAMLPMTSMWSSCGVWVQGTEKPTVNWPDASAMAKPVSAPVSSVSVLVTWTERLPEVPDTRSITIS